MVSFWKQRSRRNQIGWKVTFRNAFGRCREHNGKTTVWMWLDISCCVKSLPSDPSPPPPPLQQKGMDHSFFKVSLSSPSHHTPLLGREPRSITSRQYRLFIHPFPPLVLSSSLSPLAACFSGTLLVLHDPRAQEFLQFSVSAHTLFKLTLFSFLPPVL